MERELKKKKEFYTLVDIFRKWNTIAKSNEVDNQLLQIYEKADRPVEVKNYKVRNKNNVYSGEVFFKFALSKIYGKEKVVANIYGQNEQYLESLSYVDFRKKLVELNALKFKNFESNNINEIIKTEEVVKPKQDKSIIRKKETKVIKPRQGFMESAAEITKKRTAKKNAIEFYSNNRNKYLQTVAKEGEKFLEDERYQKMIDEKIEILFRLLRGESRHRLPTSAFSGINISKLGTIRKLNPRNEEQRAMVPTTIIEFKMESTFSAEQKGILKAVWFYLGSELQKVMNGENSTFNEFFVATNEGKIVNRFGLMIKENLSSRDTKMTNTGANSFYNLDFFPPQDGVDYKL